jgi:molecular chaperone HtpG
MAEKFQVDLGGVIDLLANHLYSSPDVFVRELLQNAADAITARRALDPAHKGQVTLDLTPASEGSPATLMVKDDGIGLTRAEVEEFLATIGTSSKRASAEELGERTDFIGRFGIGLLSCFMVTDEIVVVSRSARGSHAAVEWRGKSDGSYTVRELEGGTHEPGTRVFIRAKEGSDWYFERDNLLDLACRYAEMLPCLIALEEGGRRTDISREQRPWELSLPQDRIALSDYCQETLGFSPIEIVPLVSEVGGVRGYAFVKSGASTPNDLGGHRVYLKGMLLDQSGYGLLPSWAFFLKCVVNAETLRPIASREGLFHDGDLEKASEALGDCVRRHLVRLARQDPAGLQALLLVHDTAIRALALADDEFFDLIIDLLPFETSLGRVIFGEFRRESGRILTARTSEQYRRVLEVGAAQHVRVFNGGFTHHEELLEKAASRIADLTVESFDAAMMIDLLPEPGDGGDAAARLEQIADGALEAHGCKAVVRGFEPSATSALYGLGMDAEFHRQVDRAKARASGLWKQMLEEVAPTESERPPTRLCLNWANGVVRALAASKDDALVQTVVQVLYVQSLMNGMHPLTADETAALSRGLVELMSRCTAGGRA